MATTNLSGDYPVKLSTVQSMGSLQRSYKWDVHFIVSDDSENTESEIDDSTNTGSESESLATILDTVNLRCLSATVPTPRIEKIATNPHGITLTEPGIIYLDGQIQFKIVETKDLRARNIIHRLQQISMNDEDKKQMNIHKAGDSGSVNIIAKLKRLDNFHNENLIYTCYRCFIKDFTDPEFNSNSGTVEPEFILRYNYFDVSFA